MGELLKAKVDVNCQVTTQQSEAANALHYLSPAQHPVGETDYVAKGYSPLHLVAESGNINVARLLMGACADVNMEDYHGKTPMHIAAENDEAALVAILIE